MWIARAGLIAAGRPMCVRRAGFDACVTRRPAAASSRERAMTPKAAERGVTSSSIPSPFLVGSPRGTRRPLSSPLTDRSCPFTLCWRCWPAPKRLLRRFGLQLPSNARTRLATFEASHVKLAQHRSTKQGAKARTGRGIRPSPSSPPLLPYVERGAWGPLGCPNGGLAF